MRVPLVDDEQPRRRVLERILTQLGYDVVTAADGVEARAVLVQAEKPSIIQQVSAKMREVLGAA